jgi:hypothetical protein
MKDFVLKPRSKEQKKVSDKFPMGFKVHLDKRGTKIRFRILDSFFNLVEVSLYKYKNQKDAREAGKIAIANAKARNR